MRSIINRSLGKMRRKRSWGLILMREGFKELELVAIAVGFCEE